MDKSDLERKIGIIQQIKKFGREELGIDFENAFKDYADSKEFGWLYVTPRYKLRSIFKKPYKFYTDIGRLEKKVEFYSKDFDVHKFIGEAAGNKNCPITRSLLNSEIVRQVYVVLHEGWHMTNKSENYPLEESTGDLVGVIGTISFLGKHFPEFKSKAEYQAKEFKEFNIFIMDYYTRLRDVFQVDSCNFKRREKLNILGEADKKRLELVEQVKTGWLKDRFSQELNNAFFYRYHFYCTHYDLAEDVYQRKHDLHGTIEVFKKSLRRKDGIRYLNNLLKE